MKMVHSTLLEELPNEIFCEIFDYLNAFDLFFAFVSLNSRISSILKLTRLHVIIYSTNYRRQIEFLSRHLTFHSDQVISLDINDEIRDQTNVVAYLSRRHSFLNLRSCKFWYLHSSSKLKNVIKQLQKKTQIVSFHIIQAYHPENDQLSTNHAHLFSKKILLNTPSTLRSAVLQFHYNHPDLVRSTIIDTKLTYLKLMFYGTPDNVSVYSLIPILRKHRKLRHLDVTIKLFTSQNNNYINIPNIPSIDEDDLPISPLLKSFDLQLLIICDIPSLNLILRCMPNLREFSFTHVFNVLDTSYSDTLLNGNCWQQMLASHTPHLKTFDFNISVLMNEETFDLDGILNSFQCFVTRYDGWHMGISQWKKLQGCIPCQHIVLRTLNYKYLKPRHTASRILDICSGTYKTISTDASNANYHRFHSNIDLIEFYMPRNVERSLIQSPSDILFRNVHHLAVYLSLGKPSIISFFKNLFISISAHSHRNESREYFEHLSSLIDLSTIRELQFNANNDLTRSRVVPDILLACPNVTTLNIDNSLLFLPIIIDNPDLALTFNRINTLDIYADPMYLPLKHASKLVQRFPSLTSLDIDAHSFDSCVPIVDIFLGGLAKLNRLFVQFHHDSLLHEPYLREYVIEKRRQSFGLNKDDEYKVIVKLRDNWLFIRTA